MEKVEKTGKERRYPECVNMKVFPMPLFLGNYLCKLMVPRGSVGKRRDA